MKRFATFNVSTETEVDVLERDVIYDISNPVLDPTSLSGISVTVTLKNGVIYDGFCPSLFSNTNSLGERIGGNDDYDNDKKSS